MSLEYRLADGGSAYLQHELLFDAVDEPGIWQSLAQLPLPGAVLTPVASA